MKRKKLSDKRFAVAKIGQSNRPGCSYIEDDCSTSREDAAFKYLKKWADFNDVFSTLASKGIPAGAVALTIWKSYAKNFALEIVCVKREEM